MTHPTDDEIAAVKFYTENPSAALADFDKRRSGRALLAEQARTEPTGGFARLAPDALPVGTAYLATYQTGKATPLLKAEQAKDAAEDAELLEHLIEGVRAFRNEPMLGKLLRLRSTPGYVAMTTAWEDAVDTKDAIRAARAAERKAP